MAGRARFSPVGHADPDMGPAADRVAALGGITRARQDAYALRSHERARRAAASGVFDAELVPLAGVDVDDALRRTVTTQVLARMKPVFSATGTVTAGNTCGVYDGAAAVALVPQALQQALGVPGLAVLSTAVVGVDPEMPALGAAPAIRLALERAGVELADVDVLELTEAFAAQVLACTDQLGWDALGADGERVCPDGGAIALGHPWGASGALLAVRLFSRLVRQNQPGTFGPGRSVRLPRIGVAACAIGGGQGIAMVVERIG
jgi:acetyl-CoA C-acetyltransferase